MKRAHVGALSGAAVAALTMAMTSSAAQAVPARPTTSTSPAQGSPREDNLPNPLADAQSRLREEAVQKLLDGEATVVTRGGQKVIKVESDATGAKSAGATGGDGHGSDKHSTGKGGKGWSHGHHAGKDKYVLYDTNREESVFTVLSEFGDTTDPRTGGSAGPLHNEIPRPDRTYDRSATDDNSTYWLPDFNRAHYTDMMFGDGESFRDFYLKQSNGRFLAKGDVSDWVKVPDNEARYGSNSIPESDGYWNYIQDTVTAWYEAQKAKGTSDADITSYLAQFDQVDRYDYDNDGNFNEPDGYIDHFQAIHAGEGEEAGAGPDKIWSHRWYAFADRMGKAGPAGNPAGGVQIGDTGLWVGDYTTEPENGGLGVFSHEFGHDLGLPDLYDTQGGENSTGMWTLMSGGSWLNHGGDAIGTTPGYMGPWEKMQLGWLDYAVAPYGRSASYRVGPADRDGRTTPQALAVQLPDKTITTEYNTPHSGSSQWWSGSADNLNVSLSRTLDLTGASSSASLSAWLWYNIEAGYDFLTLEARPQGATSWTQVGDLLDGTQTSWTQHTWDLSPYAGSTLDVRFRYYGDGGVHYQGAFVDDVAATADGRTVLSDDVESGDAGWTADGFTRTSGTTTRSAAHYYLAENRVYTGYDATLRTGPYNFGWGTTRPDFVERFPYQNGLLVWYVDNEYEDNNTSVHPGGGQVLPVDARPGNLVFSDGYRLANRRQVFDATFGRERTDAVTFHHNGVPMRVGARPAMPRFTDADPDRYYDPSNKLNSVKVAGTGTSITVTHTSKDRDSMVLKVGFRG